ncbi:hypothetical protein LJR118_005036 [Acidovorax sp. LjRoot118]|uniref:hypothetical protein n=1 Tax=Acidovorax sp. LjRoot118 TaxID=3342256 RepID=UPI003ED1494B
MPDCIGIDAEAARARVATRINKLLRWTGDLGRKFNPPLCQVGVVLSPDWPIVAFHTSGGFNDRMVDLVFSPKAQYNATILLFGDSFFRMMRRHLSAVFTRVVCLRSRFFHPEIAASIQSDVVLSGNAERYFSAVAPDSEAQLFSLYLGFLRAPEIQADTAFLAAWSSVNAPRSSASQRFFSDLRTPPRDGSSPPFPNPTRSTFS